MIEPRLDAPPRAAGPFSMVVIAASTGGPRAYMDLFRRLPANFDAPIVFVQHRAPAPDSHLAEVLEARARITVEDATDRLLPRAGHAYLVPPRMIPTFDDLGRLRLVRAFTRSVANPLFDSAARVFRERSIGVVLTGNLDDAAAGVCEIKAAGGRVLVQEPGNASAPGMPLAALATGCVDFRLSVPAIAAALTSFVMTAGAAKLFEVPTPHWAARGRRDLMPSRP